ncbi:hypothetical protein BIFADO_01874, partial [Bifidobacterium adolescentis L2-32]
MFRRAICDVPTNSLRQTFATFCRKLDKNPFNWKSVQARLS